MEDLILKVDDAPTISLKLDKPIYLGGDTVSSVSVVEGVTFHNAIGDSDVGIMPDATGGLF